MKISKELYASYTLVNLFLFCSSTYFCKIFWPHFDELFAFALHKMDSDEEDFSPSGLTQNTFLADPVILDDELSIISSILETENLDFGNSESTSANTSHAESTNARNISLISDEELQRMKEA
jgi:hypothetical protein